MDSFDPCMRRRARHPALQLLLVLVVAFMSCAHAGANFQLESLTPDQLHLAPGESTAYSLRIRNVGDVAGTAYVSGEFYILNRFQPYPYTLGPADDARCGAIHVNDPSSLWFVTSSIAPGAFLDCEWSVDRPLASIYDTWLVWSTTGENHPNSGLTVIGTLTNTSIAARTMDFSIDDQGIGHATIQLSIHNGGQLPIDEQSAGACYVGQEAVIVLSGDGDTGCGNAHFSPACFTGGGYGFALPALQPGETHRCTFEIRSAQTYTQPLAAEFMIDRAQGSNNTVLLFDTNESDNQTYAWLAPLGSYEATDLISLRWPALALLIVLCGFLGLRRHRGHTR